MITFKKDRIAVSQREGKYSVDKPNSDRFRWLRGDLRSVLSECIGRT